jgi:hypothetical protein
MKKVFIALLMLTACNRTSVGNIKNCVIVKQYCGFDNLDGGYYVVRDLTTNRIYRIDVDIRECDIYNVGDTIK